MKRVLYILLIVFATTDFTSGQNLIFNGGFEQYDTCPDYASQLYKASGYTQHYTCDYFHYCTDAWQAYPPTNAIHPAEPFEGLGYAGVITGGVPPDVPLNDTSYTYREIFTGRLTQPLQSGRLYCFTARVMAANDFEFYSDALDVLFVTDTLSFYSFSSPTLYNFTPQVRNTRVFTDSSHWQLMSGAFVAQDAYRFFHMGNMRPYTQNMQLFQHGSFAFSNSIYHLIDDLQLTELSRPEFLYTHTCEGAALAASVSGADSVRWYRNGQLFSQQPNILLSDIQPGESLIAEYFLCNYTFTDTVTVPPCTVPEPEFPNIITPNADGVNDVFIIEQLAAGSTLVIYNRWGSEVFKTDNYDNNWQGVTQTLGIETQVTDGTYFYVLITPEGKQYKGTVTLAR